MRKRRTPELPPELRTRAELDLRVMRAIVTFLGGWMHCHKGCRRAKRCADREARCFDANLPRIRADLESLAAWRRLDGPRSEAELQAPPRVLID